MKSTSGRYYQALQTNPFQAVPLAASDEVD